MPQDWIDVILASLYKGKAEKSIYDHYHGIILLGSVGKVLARLLLNRLTENICPGVISVSQNFFRSGRGTVDMIVSVRQIQGKCIEQKKPLYQVFVDMAFDTVNREAFWKTVAKIGCPKAFVNIFKELHGNMKTRVTFNGQLLGELVIDNGVKQGAILLPHYSPFSSLCF